MKQKQVWAIVVLVVAVIALGAYWYINRPINQTADQNLPTPTATNTNTNNGSAPPVTTAPTPDAPPAAGDNYLSIGDQPTGKSVAVDALSLGAPGFVAIHESDNGKPGKIIGTSGLIAAGAKVDLLVKASVVYGKTYFAMLHSDDGNKKFDETKDLPVKTAAGLIIMRQFSVK